MSENIPNIRNIFVCTHADGSEKHCNNNGEAHKIFKKLREIAKNKGLHPQIRVTQAKCLGQCAQGPNIMIYPENTWYKNVSIKDVNSIANSYINK